MCVCVCVCVQTGGGAQVNYDLDHQTFEKNLKHDTEKPR